MSLDPPLVLVCIAKGAASRTTFCSSGHFAVNVLAETQRNLSSLFASKAADRFAGVEWSPGAAGDPILAGVVAWFECETHQQVDAGDHVILVGKVLAFGSSFASPLGYCRGAYVAFSLSQNALSAASPRTRVGVILERDGAVALLEGADCSLAMPSGPRLGTPDDADSLLGLLRRHALNAKFTFLFSVFEDQRCAEGCLSVYYRGDVVDASSPRPPVRLIPFDAIPWARMRDIDEVSMLRRFVRERQENTFEVFAGTTRSGTLHALHRQQTA